MDALDSYLQLKRNYEKATGCKFEIKDHNFVRFVTFQGINLLGLYNPKYTTIKNVVETFFENYDCNEAIEHSNIVLNIAGIDKDVRVSPVGIDHSRGWRVTAAVHIDIAVTVDAPFEFIGADHGDGEIILVAPDQACACISRIEALLESLYRGEKFRCQD